MQKTTHPDHRPQYSKAEFNKHLKEEHAMSPISFYLKEIVYGGSDGIVTTFAVVAGFAGATGGEQISLSIPAITVLIFGLANLFADGTSMALGNYLSIRADQDVYHDHQKKENEEIINHPEMEWAETVHILKEKGFEKKDAEHMADIYKKNKICWTDFMMEHELEMSNPENEHPLYTSIATFFSFILFGSIPLLPYVVFNSSENIFFLSIAFTLSALLLLGLLRWKTGQSHMIRAVGEIVLLGSVSATIAYLVGTFFRL